MRSIVFSMESASFTFPMSEVVNCLDLYISKFNVEEAREILSRITSSTEQVIEVPGDQPWFGYVTLDLIEKEIGKVHCKACDRTYDAGKLFSTETGCGESPLSPKLNLKGGMLKIFNFGMTGGKGFICPQRHELISMVTWIT